MHYDGGNFNLGTSTAESNVKLDGNEATKITWKKVTTTAEIFDPRTGQPKDPLYRFY